MVEGATFAREAADRLHAEALRAKGLARSLLFRERDEAEAWLRKILASMTAAEFRKWVQSPKP